MGSVHNALLYIHVLYIVVEKHTVGLDRPQTAKCVVWCVMDLKEYKEWFSLGQYVK